MTRRVCLYIVGSLVLLSLAGCGRGFFQTAQREAWRHEAEVACLKSGQLKEGTELVRIKPISGPGVCGADFPLKVASLGSSSALGFAGDLRPPGNVPGGGQPNWPVRRSQPSYAQPSYPAQQPYPAARLDSRPAPQPAPAAYPGSGAMPLHAPGVSPQAQDIDLPSEGSPREASHGSQISDASQTSHGSHVPDRRDSYLGQEAQPYRLGPSRGNPVAAIGPVALKPNPTLACPITSMLDRWITDAIQPAAMRWFGSPVAEIKQISAYSCRGMNGKPNARISEHAFGNALDIAGFTLADGRRISVQHGWKGMPEEQGFLRDVHAAACEYFSTVLSPGSNVYHYNHIHVDLMRRKSSRSICRPAAVSGDEIAARAGGRNAYAGQAGATGSIGKRSRAPAAVENEDEIDTQ